MTHLKRQSNDQSLPRLFNAISFLPVGITISQVANRANNAFLLVAETRDPEIALSVPISPTAFLQPVWTLQA